MVEGDYVKDAQSLVFEMRVEHRRQREVEIMTRKGESRVQNRSRYALVVMGVSAVSSKGT
jgi:hypothetical protein